MNKETVKEIFLSIAFHAMDTGKNLRLSNSDTDYDSLVMEVFPQDQAMSEETGKEENDNDTGTE